MMTQSKTIALPGMTTDSEDDSPTLAGRQSIDELSRSASNADKKNSSSGEESKNGFGQSLLDAGIGSKLVSSLSRPSMKEPKSARNLLQTKSSSKLEIMAMLEEWEEPDIKTNSAVRSYPIFSIQFINQPIMIESIVRQLTLLVGFVVKGFDQGHTSVQTGSGIDGRHIPFHSCIWPGQD